MLNNDVHMHLFDDILIDACKKGQHKIVIEFLNTKTVDMVAHSRAESASKGRTPLVCACGSQSEGHLEIIKTLLDRGVSNVDESATSNWTPLQRACWEGHVQVVQLLLARGATLEKASNGGQTALHRACQRGHTDVIKLLLQHGANLDIIAKPSALSGCFPASANTVLRQWDAATSARRDAVRRHGWQYVDVPYKWTPANHNKFPVAFQQQICALSLAWLTPFTAMGKAPAPFVEMVAAAYHGAVGLQ